MHAVPYGQTHLNLYICYSFHARHSCFILGNSALYIIRSPTARQASYLQHPGLTLWLALQSSRADLTRSEAKLAETLASMDSMDKTLAAQIERTEELQSQIQLSQDRVAEAEAAAVAAEEDLKSAEQKMAELTGSLDSARVNHDQVVAELQQQHADQTQVGCCSSCCDVL